MRNDYRDKPVRVGGGRYVYTYPANDDETPVDSRVVQMAARGVVPQEHRTMPIRSDAYERGHDLRWLGGLICAASAALVLIVGWMMIGWWIG